MNKPSAFTAVALFAALAASQAAAAPLLDAEGSLNVAASAVSTKSRAEVKAELAQARRDGTVEYLDAEGSLRVPVRLGNAKSRDQIKAELAEAQRRGDIVANDDTGRTLRDVFPAQYLRVQ